ncbi:MAG: hypothetical protein ONB06_09830 [candidate division KSB1 bacterium]|nr:hypothetical protein [candidate division KSB1 bacterium]
MAVVSGVLFAVNIGGTAVPAVGLWSVEYTHEPAVYAALETRGAMRRVCGPKRWRGRVAGFGVPPALLPGDGLSSPVGFVGAIAPTWATTPPPATPGVSGDIVVRSLAVQGDFDSNAPLQWQIEFVGASALTTGDVSVGIPSGAPPACSEGSSVLWNGVALPDVARWQFSLVDALESYISSGTAGVEKHVRGLRDAQLQYTQYADSAASLPSIGDVQSAKVVMATGDEFFFDYMKMLEWTVNAQRSSSKPFAFDVRMGLCIVNPSGTLGTVKRNTTVWIP